MAGAAIFFVGNMISNQLSTTGAFEVFINDTLVFSKIQTGNAPTAQALLQELAAYGIGE